MHRLRGVGDERLTGWPLWPDRGLNAADNVFTARLIDAAAFELRGPRYDLREVIGPGMRPVTYQTISET